MVAPRRTTLDSSAANVNGTNEVWVTEVMTISFAGYKYAERGSLYEQGDIGAVGVRN
jgi:hypothetical protein